MLLGLMFAVPKPGVLPSSLPSHCHEGRQLEPFSKAPAGWDSREPKKSPSSAKNSDSSGEIEAYDIVIYGATGFTGTHVARYLAQLSNTANEQYYGRLQLSPESKDNESALEGNKRRPFSFALAGRSISKLAALRDELEHDYPAAGTLVRGTVGGFASPSLEGGRASYSIGILVADAGEAHSLGLMASRTHVVLSTAGPYTEHGSALVAACAATGTHYADLSGEPFWQRDMIDAHDATARRTGAKIVLASGYDSVPFDLGYLYTFNQFREEAKKVANMKDNGNRILPQHPTDIRVLVEVSRGWLSGGTLASALKTFEEVLFGSVSISEALDPYLLVPPPHAAAVQALRANEHADSMESIELRPLEGYEDYDINMDEFDDASLIFDADGEMDYTLPIFEKLHSWYAHVHFALRKRLQRRPPRPSELSCRSDTELSGWGNLPRYDGFMQNGGIPHFMAAINARIVRRSMALLGHRNCSYAEGISFGALLDAAIFMASHVLSNDMPLSALLPHRGVGPSAGVMRDGCGRIKVVASAPVTYPVGEEKNERGFSRSGSGGLFSVTTRVAYAGDPGYNATSKILAEAGLCLADPDCHGEAPGGPGGGVTTPAVAMGLGLVRRLTSAEVVEFSLVSATLPVATPNSETRGH